MSHPSNVFRVLNNVLSVSLSISNISAKDKPEQLKILSRNCSSQSGYHMGSTKKRMI